MTRVLVVDALPTAPTRLVPEEPVALVVHRFVHAPDGAGEVEPDLDPAAVTAAGALEPGDTAARLAAWEETRRCWPEVPHRVVYDTVFFRDLPAVARHYALPPAEAVAAGLVRCGRHGPVHRQAAAAAGASRVVSVLLGPEASAAAVCDGRPVEVTAGCTGLEGIPGGFTCGDLDPAAVLFLLDRVGLSLAEVETALSREGGLAGISRGRSSLAALRAAGDADAALAIAHLVHRVRRAIGSLTAVLGGLDALVLNGGPDDLDEALVATLVQGLSYLGIGEQVPVRTGGLTPALAALAAAT